MFFKLLAIFIFLRQILFQVVEFYLKVLVGFRLFEAINVIFIFIFCLFIFFFFFSLRAQSHACVFMCNNIFEILIL